MLLDWGRETTRSLEVKTEGAIQGNAEIHLSRISGLKQSTPFPWLKAFSSTTLLFPSFSFPFPFFLLRGWTFLLRGAIEVPEVSVHSRVSYLSIFYTRSLNSTDPLLEISMVARQGWTCIPMWTIVQISMFARQGWTWILMWTIVYNADIADPFSWKGIHLELALCTKCSGNP